MTPNKYTPFEYKGKYQGKFGLKNNSSPFKNQNKLKYIFSTKKEAEKFAASILESERKRKDRTEWKHISGGRFDTQIRCEIVFLVLKNFRFYG